MNNDKRRKQNHALFVVNVPVEMEPHFPRWIQKKKKENAINGQLGEGKNLILVHSLCKCVIIHGIPMIHSGPVSFSAHVSIIGGDIS